MVFTVAGETASMHTVSPGLETDGWVEIEGDSLEAGASVVTMGQFLLEDGSPVAVQVR